MARDLAQRRRVAIAGRGARALLERPRIGGVDRGVLADDVGLDASADHEVLERPDGAEREHERQQQASDDALAQVRRTGSEAGKPHQASIGTPRRRPEPRGWR